LIPLLHQGGEPDFLVIRTYLDTEPVPARVLAFNLLAELLVTHVKFVFRAAKAGIIHMINPEAMMHFDRFWTALAEICRAVPEVPRLTSTAVVCAALPTARPPSVQSDESFEAVATNGFASFQLTQSLSHLSLNTN
jgi:hypothetical protein